MNIIGLPLIYICYRFWQFSKIMPADLPAISSEDHSRMISYSNWALLIIVVTFLLSIGLAGLKISKQSLLIANGPALIGIAIAAYFDIQAEKIKRLGKAGNLTEVSGRPASVIVSIILFGIFALAGTLLLIANPKSNIFFFMVSWVVLSLIAAIALCLKTKWARIYSSVLIGLLGLFYLVVTVLSLVRKNYSGINIMFIVFCLLCWWGYCLAYGKAASDYFSRS
jgi:hypothetical protein